LSDYQKSRAGFPIFIQNAIAQQVPFHHNPAMPILLFSVVENAQEPTKFTFDEFGCAFN